VSCTQNLVLISLTFCGQDRAPGVLHLLSGRHTAFIQEVGPPAGDDGENAFPCRCGLDFSVLLASRERASEEEMVFCPWLASALEALKHGNPNVTLTCSPSFHVPFLVVD
jgi:hypothetical protein